MSLSFSCSTLIDHNTNKKSPGAFDPHEINPEKFNENESFQEKCGEIFVENGKYYFICQFCTENHENLDNFIEHISIEHLEPEDESEVSSDSCSSDSDDNDNELTVTTTQFCDKNLKLLNSVIDMKEVTVTEEVYEDEGEDEDERDDVEEQPETISCEPDTGMFYESEDSDMIATEGSSLNVLQNDEQNQDDDMQFDWNGQIRQLSKEKDGRFYCEFCQKSYTYSKSLKEHVEAIHKKQEKLFKCHLCEKAFSKRWKLNTHLKVHTDERPFECSLCVMTFKWKKNLQRHLIRVHSVKYSDLLYEMSRDEIICPRATTSPSDNEEYPIIKNLLLTTGQIEATNNSIKLEKDLDEETPSSQAHEHLGFTLTNKPQSSNICNQLNAINEETARMIDIKSEHINDEDETNIDAKLNVDIQLDNVSDGLFACKICKKMYLRKETLKAHEKIHTSGLNCELCPKVFTHKYYLDRHMRSHPSEHKTKSFKCHICSFACAHEKNLYSHMKSHFDEITDPPLPKKFKHSYSCACGGVFNIRKDYRHHRKTCSLKRKRKS